MESKKIMYGHICVTILNNVWIASSTYPGDQFFSDQPKLVASGSWSASSSDTAILMTKPRNHQDKIHRGNIVKAAYWYRQSQCHFQLCELFFEMKTWGRPDNQTGRQKNSQIISLIMSTSLETPHCHCILQIFATLFMDKVNKIYNMQWKLPMKGNLVMSGLSTLWF